MSRKYTQKEDIDVGEIEKVLTLRGDHAEKLHELRAKFGWSARRAACFVLAYTHELESVMKTPRRLLSIREGTKAWSLRGNPADGERINLFLPMTPRQANLADEAARGMNFDFTSFFKINLDLVYEDFKAGKLEMKKNNLTRRFVDGRI